MGGNLKKQAEIRKKRVQKREKNTNSEKSQQYEVYKMKFNKA